MALQNAFAGLATEPKQDTGNTSLASIDGKTPALESGRVPVAVQAALRDWAPGYNAAPGGTASLTADPDGALITRGSVLTDEGSTRVNFANSSLAVTIGSCTFTNGSTAVTGSNFSSLVLDKGDYIKLDADAESAWAQVESIDSDSAITLTAEYSGSGGSSTASRAMVKPTTGTGGTIAVASGVCTLASGTTINQTTSIERLIDYSPIGANIGVTVSQRIANNDTYIELRDPSATSKYFCRIRLTGTTNTAAICETGYNPTTTPSASETESTTVTLPNGATTAAARIFRIESVLSATRYYCDGILIAEHRKIGPHPNDPMLLKVSTVNGGSAPATSTTVTVDHLLAQNFNSLNVDTSSQNTTVIAQNSNPDVFTGSAGALNADAVVIDCAKYRELWISASGTYSATISVQASNTPDFAVVTSAQFAGFAGGGGWTSLSTGSMYVVAVRARYYRVRATAWTSGTANVTVQGVANAGAVRQVHVETVGSNITTAEAGLITPTASNVNSAATTNATSVKASAGTVYAISASNINAAARYLKLYNKASAPTVGTDVPLLTITLSPTQPTILEWGRVGWRFATGIAFAITANAADSDTTAVAASEIKVNISYI